MMASLATNPQQVDLLCLEGLTTVCLLWAAISGTHVGLNIEGLEPIQNLEGNLPCKSAMAATRLGKLSAPSKPDELMIDSLEIDSDISSDIDRTDSMSSISVPFGFPEKESAELLDSYLDGLSAVDATDAMVEVSFDTENGRKVALPRDIKSRSERLSQGAWRQYGSESSPSPSMVVGL
ncbi:unnamed protein product [Durusdinium trenchii]|uniref:Uncharacterized protein n=2 Tax=Durusdinium trenchii TaxID=1381693 RepID=A0ABP0IGQ7_9DINO